MAKKKIKKIKKGPVRAKKAAPKKTKVVRKAKKTVRKAPPKKKPVRKTVKPRTRAAPKISRPAKKPASKKKTPKRQGKIEITPDILRIWINIRRAWVVSYFAFNHSIAVINENQANELYDVVKHSLYKDSYAEILHKHPELRPLLQTDEDRLCMHDIYERLSWRLNRREKLPADKRASKGMKGKIGRNMPDLMP